MKGPNSYVLLTPTPPPSAAGPASAPRMERALIWKGIARTANNDRVRPLTCSYSFGKGPPRDTVRSAKARPQSFLRQREGEGGGVHSTSAHSRRTSEDSQPVQAGSCRGSAMKTDDELESVLCLDDDRARQYPIDTLLLSDDDVEELTDYLSPKKVRQDTPAIALRCRTAFSPPQQPRSNSPPSGGDPVTPFMDPSDAAPEHSVPPIEKQGGLELALKAHGIEGSAAVAVRRLGVRRIGDLTLLKAQDLEGPASGFNVLERRLVLTAIEKENTAAKRCREDMMSASRTWSRLTDDRGWYSPPFSTEPPGLRVTVLEPMDIAGTVMDISFGESRASLTGGVTRSFLDESTGHEKFELKLRLGRADRTEFDAASGHLNFNVVGVSRDHAEIVLTCGDGQPSTCRIKDLNSTNGTFLIRPASSHTVYNNSQASADSEEESVGELSFRRPGTSPDSLLERRVEDSFPSDASGVPYLRLGPKLCLGLSLLRGSEANFKFQDVQVVTEKLQSESELRSLGWEDACLDHVLAAKRRKERVNVMIDKFAAGSRAVARKASSTHLNVPSLASPQEFQVPREILVGSPARRRGIEEQHVFLSYQWDCQPIVKAVSEQLKKRGYKVWLDLEQMRGEMNQRMAEAVEGAAVVCPFISRAYKTSANCMKELNYSDQLGKPMLPIIVDDFNRKEMLRGAVGLITSNIIYLDFSRFGSSISNNPSAPMPQDLATLFESKMSEMERALGGRGKLETPPTTTSDPCTKPQPVSDGASCVHPSSERHQCAEAVKGSVGGVKATPSLPSLPKIV